MTSVGRVALVVIVLYILLVLFYDPMDSPLWVNRDGNIRRASCHSNLKQLGLAMVQYSQDYDNTLPTYASANGHGWREAVYPFVKSVGVYRCPDDPRDAGQATPENLPKSYAANNALLGHSLASVNSDSVSAADTRGFDGEDWDICSPAFLPSTGRTLYAHLPRHIFYDHPSGTINCLFADGHVKAEKPAATLAPTNLWTRDNAPFLGSDFANAQAILKHAEKE